MAKKKQITEEAAKRIEKVVEKSTKSKSLKDDFVKGANKTIEKESTCK